MTRKPENPAAYPGACTSEGYAPNYGSVNEGMTLRDYFAAAALPGVMKRARGEIDGLTGSENMLLQCQVAYEFADGMLIERSKQ